MGRIAMGGDVSFVLPHDTSTLDPFDLFDPVAALLASSVVETVYRYDRSGNVYASLAEALPEQRAGLTRVTLRQGLTSGLGRELSARDLLWSVNRAKSMDARAVLQGVGQGSVDPANPRTVAFRNTDPNTLARALASPLVPLVSRHYAKAHPDGTGPFVAYPSSQSLLLKRNGKAARGAAYLRQVRIDRGANLRDSLRAFEARKTDIGWLGAGLYQPRKDAKPFDFGAAAWIVLRTGREAGAWHAPGVAQQLVASIEPARLAHLGLGAVPAVSSKQRWSGPACALLAPARSAHLIEVATTVASILSQTGNEVQPLAIPKDEFTARRQSRGFCLMVDVVRPVGPPGLATLLALVCADDPARATSLASSPPRLSSFDPRVIARTLHLGILGNLQVRGAHDQRLHLARCDDPSDSSGWDLPGSYLKRLTRR